MKQVIRQLKQFCADEEGASGVEYALLTGLIAVAFVAGATLLGGSINTLLTNIAACVDGTGSCTVR